MSADVLLAGIRKDFRAVMIGQHRVDDLFNEPPSKLSSRIRSYPPEITI